MLNKRLDIFNLDQNLFDVSKHRKKISMANFHKITEAILREQTRSMAYVNTNVTSYESAVKLNELKR